VKRFRWPLQRLLDVTGKRETALRGDLARLGRRIEELRRAVAARRTALRRQLSELDGRRLPERLADQELFLRCAAVEEKAIEKLLAAAEDVRREHAAKREELLAVRRKRRTLERLREEARERYDKDLAAFEQKQLDEAASISFARAAAHGGRWEPKHAD